MSNIHAGHENEIQPSLNFKIEQALALSDYSFYIAYVFTQLQQQFICGQ